MNCLIHFELILNILLNISEINKYEYNFCEIVVLEALIVTIVGAIYAAIAKLIINYFSSIIGNNLRYFSLLLVPILTTVLFVLIAPMTTSQRLVFLIAILIISTLSYFYWYKNRAQLWKKSEKYRLLDNLKLTQPISMPLNGMLLPNQLDLKEFPKTKHACMITFPSFPRFTYYHFWVFVWLIALFTIYVVTKDTVLAALIIAVPPSMLAIKQLNTSKNDSFNKD